MKNEQKIKIPEKTEKAKSVNSREKERKDDKNTEKTLLAYKEWMKYKNANK